MIHDDPSKKTEHSPSPLTRRNALELIGKTSLVALLASACRLPSPPPEVVDTKRPNIIYLHSHDTGRHVEPYGYNVSTPHLQRFAEEGMLFRQAFSASPTCSPSRAALLTGMTPGCNGMWGLAHKGSELNDYAQTLVQMLKRAGYTTALSGIQHIAAGDPQTCAERIGYDTLLKTQGTLGEHVADAAIRYLERPPLQPFFLDVGFAETHLLKIKGQSRFGYGSGDPDTADIPSTLRDTPATRRDMADYEVAVGALDEQMGRVLSALERSGLAQNTLVICTTDHGIPIPGMKSNHNDNGLGVMLMMRGPGGFSGGQVSNALVSQLDIFPTLCELLGVAAPEWLQGKSLLPLVRGEVAEINDAVFAEYEAHKVVDPQASVRTRQYKYIRRLDGNNRSRPANTDETYTKELWLREGWDARLLAPEQLYDLAADPHEQNNLVNDPSYGDVLVEMRGLLVARMEDFDNPLLRRYNVSAEAPSRIRATFFQEALRGSEGDPEDLGVIFSE